VPRVIRRTPTRTTADPAPRWRLARPVQARSQETIDLFARAAEERRGPPNEMAGGLPEAPRGSADIVQTIVGVASTAETTSDGANDTLQASTQLAQMASDLQTLVSRFTV